MALNVVEAHVRETIAAQWPERCLTIGRTANLTEGKPDEERAPCQYRSICARAVPMAPISRRNPPRCPPR
jgi:hypothetical protein